MSSRSIRDLSSGELIGALRAGTVADASARRQAAIQLAERLAAQGHPRAARIVIGRHGGDGPVVIEVTPAPPRGPATEISERGWEISAASEDFEDREITRPYTSPHAPHPIRHTGRHTGRRTWKHTVLAASPSGGPIDFVFEGPDLTHEEL
jgi:hypothetical protein